MRVCLSVCLSRAGAATEMFRVLISTRDKINATYKAEHGIVSRRRRV